MALVEPGYTRTAFEQNTIKPDRSIAVYDAVRADMEVQMRKSVEAGDDPEVVAETIVKAATAEAPKRRYTAGKLAGQADCCVVSSPSPRSTRACGNRPACRSDARLGTKLRLKD
ncbi:hypothetical protein J2Z31_000622 [Sinorhizobium kostiense]|uniref:Uncharacterized protein n=1 Tax=Sinorhizobium kostiense TaxID=76747 RepID=A0ABS4QU17_9HYPH|nr:hypothetical protein [Sinorhizobium kostiense]